MLATDFNERYLRFPCIVQPKLNGIRAMIYPNGLIMSRGGKEITVVTAPSVPFTLDGEWYLHGLSLQRINGAITPARSTPSLDTALVKFHAFDIVTVENLTQLDRLNKLFDTPIPGIMKVPFRICHSLSEVYDAYDAEVQNGYEGVIIRTVDNLYHAGKTPAVMKLKSWTDAEATIVDFTSGKETDTGSQFCDSLGAIVAVTPGGVRFKIGSGFTPAERADIWARRSALLGLEVKYKYTSLSDNNTPITPIFMAVLE